MGGAETELRGTLGGLLLSGGLFLRRRLFLLWEHRVRRRAVRDGAVDLPRLWLRMQRLRGLPGRPAQGGRLLARHVVHRLPRGVVHPGRHGPERVHDLRWDLLIIGANLKPICEPVDIPVNIADEFANDITKFQPVFEPVGVPKYQSIRESE